MQQKIELD